jgi:formylglycine-generating enzyme required for sulfatase activity
MCAAEAPLKAGSVRTVRLGPKPITSTRTCKYKAVSGAASVRIEIPEPGTYQFEVVGFRPPEADLALTLRRACADEPSEISCNDDRSANDRRPLLVESLSPGTYSVIVAGLLESEDTADVDLRWGPAAGGATPAPSDPRPRLMVDGVDRTPTEEPQPGVTIDRLVAFDIVPGRRATVQVALRGACFGTMSRLGAEPHTPTLKGAMTCIDETRPWVAVESNALARADGILRAAARLPRTFGKVAACAAEPSERGRVCVAGGAFVLDDAQFSAFRSGTGLTPRFERVAEVDSFLLDQYEVSVGAWRAALRAGFVPPRVPTMNEGPIPSRTAGFSPAELETVVCTFSARDRERESYALTCVDWASARAYCRFLGGDLPTQAQWTYAAAIAGSAEPRRFPWGNARQTCPIQAIPKATEELSACCAQSVFARSDDRKYGDIACSPYGVGPQPIDTRSSDRTPLDIVGLAGGVGEWVLDAFGDGDHPCLTGAPVRNPQCDDDVAPSHTSCGSAFHTPEEGLLNGNLFPYASSGRRPVLGFRCAYPARSP